MTGLLLLDAASLYYRAFYGVPDRRRDPADPPTNAVRGLLDMIATLATQHAPTGLVACWDDDWRPAFRVQAIPEYKAARTRILPDGTTSEDSPAELDVQVPVIRDALAAIGIARIGAPGYEADDVIGTLAHRWATGPDNPVHVVTGDRDLFQLVDDAAGIDVLYTARTGVRGATLVDEAYLANEYGVRGGPGYADFATLRGDPSDGLPGVKGIGEKTARALLEQFGTLADLRAAAADPESALTATQRRRIQDSSDYLDAARTVVQVARDAPIPPFSPALPTQPADLRMLSRLAADYRLGSTFERVLDALGMG